MPTDRRPLLPRPGDELPEVRVDLGSSRLVAYAGATWDWHPLHHDTAYARAAGLERPVADGQMFGALLASALQRWAGGSARLESLGMRYRRPVYVDDTVALAGRVTGVDGDEDGVRVRLEQTVRNGGSIAVSATAALLLPPSAGHQAGRVDEGTPR